jgi:hypothetical protein
LGFLCARPAPRSYAAAVLEDRVKALEDAIRATWETLSEAATDDDAAATTTLEPIEVDNSGL